MEPLFILLASSIEAGITVAIVGFLIVFCSLTVLVIVFTQLPKLIYMKVRKAKVPKKSKTEQAAAQDEFNVEGNVTAAISLAMHMYFNELHDEESNIVTIKKVKKAYSPWSSKIYSVHNNWPR